VYFRPTAQTISNSPARTSSIQTILPPMSEARYYVESGDEKSQDLSVELNDGV
jgi:hypothetical protein